MKKPLSSPTTRINVVYLRDEKGRGHCGSGLLHGHFTTVPRVHVVPAKGALSLSLPLAHFLHGCMADTIACACLCLLMTSPLSPVLWPGKATPNCRGLSKYALSGR